LIFGRKIYYGEPGENIIIKGTPLFYIETELNSVKNVESVYLTGWQIFRLPFPRREFFYLESFDKAKGKRSFNININLSL